MRAARVENRATFNSILIAVDQTRLRENAIRNVPQHDQLVVAGDFNAVKGSGRSGFEQVVRPFGSGTPNDNSSRFLALCALIGLLVVGSWFRRANVRRWTWVSNDGRTWSLAGL